MIPGAATFLGVFERIGNALRRFDTLGAFLDARAGRGGVHDADADYARLRAAALDSQTAFDCVSLPRGARRADLLARALVLDADTLERAYADHPRPIGVFKPAAGSRITQGLTLRLARRLAANSAPKDRAAFAAAWFFPLWTEMTTLLPARRLARRISATVGDRLVLVPIAHDRIACLAGWGANELEPFMIATELRRHGAAVLLFADAGALAHRLSRARGSLHFTVARAWRAKTSARLPDQAASRFFVPDGIRNAPDVRRHLGASALVGNPARTRKGKADVLLWGRDSMPRGIKVELRRTSAPDLPVVLSPIDTVPGLKAGFLRLIGPLTAIALANARVAVNRTGAREAHVCDHLFFSSALVTHAVAETGGKAIIWPHSTNAVHVAAQDPSIIAKVTTITRSAARAWARILPHDRIRINSGCMLSPATGPRKGDPNEPIHVVVFAGAHGLRRLPLVDRARHDEAWRALLAGLESLPDDFLILLKPKAPWETMTWLGQFMVPGGRAHETSIAATQIDLPNMIFISVSLGSSALLEGLGRGIPCMIARPVAVEDYTALDPAVFPIGSVDTIIMAIRHCRDAAVIEETARRQLQWYSEEAFFPDVPVL